MILTVCSDDVAARWPFILQIPRSWPSDRTQDPAHVVRAVGFFSPPSPFMIYPLSHLIRGPAFRGTRRSETKGTCLAVAAPWFCMPTRGKNVFSRLISFLPTVERTAVAARHATPGTGQERPLPGHGRTQRGGLPQSHALSPTPLLETLAAITGCRRCSPRGGARSAADHLSTPPIRHMGAPPARSAADSSSSRSMAVAR
jgi:hypothetical protein